METKRHFTNGLWKITKNTVSKWLDADPFGQSALVAYYAIFSIPPLLVIVISLAGLVFGREAVMGQISSQIGSAIGHDTAKQVEDIIAKSSGHKTSVIASIIGFVTLVLGSIGVFAQLQTSLNLIWGVKVNPQKKWLKKIKDNLLSFGMVLSIAFLLLVSLLITAALTAFSAWVKVHLADFWLYLFKILDFVLSFGVITVLFALMYKILPDARIHWRDVWIGAIATSLLFLLGKFALGIYFGKAEPASAYGAAGSIILIMLWVSYSCMIFFLGAEFTKQYAVFHGRHLEPVNGAEIINEAEKEKKEHRAA
ncbi:MAG: YihY/virulence factor BrkB family protein [Bacteroidia bacterium]